MKRDRRQFLTATTTLGLGLLSTGLTHAQEKAKGKEEAEAGVTATEDLMREHGVLERILLIYEAGLRRLGSQEEVPAEVFHRSADLIQKFVEDYHEKLEEDHVFPEFRKHEKLVELVNTLFQQHQAGRRLTDIILHNSEAERFDKEDARKALRHACRSFIRMYRPHMARENTVLFPAMHTILTSDQLDKLGDQFEEEENRRFGKEGFEKTVEQVATIEKQLGIYELAQFTPKVSERAKPRQ